MISNYLKNGVVGALALICAGARLVPGTDQHGPVFGKVATLVAAERPHLLTNLANNTATAKVDSAIRVFASAVGPLSHCLLYTSPSPRDGLLSRMPSSA